MIRRAAKAAMHARNRFRDGYDFQQLVAASPSRDWAQREKEAPLTG